MWIQNWAKNIIYITFECIPLIVNKVDSEETGNWRKKITRKKPPGLLHKLQTVIRVIQQHYSPLHPQWFSNYKRKAKEKTDDQSVSSNFLFLFPFDRWPAGSSERINQSPQSQSLSYQRAAGWESGAKGDASSPRLWVTLRSPALSYPCTSKRRIQRNIEPATHMQTHSYTCINNGQTEIESLSLRVKDYIQGWWGWTDDAALSNV